MPRVVFVLMACPSLERIPCVADTCHASNAGSCWGIRAFRMEASDISRKVE